MRAMTTPESSEADGAATDPEPTAELIEDELIIEEMTTSSDPAAAAPEPESADLNENVLVEDELIIEEISIDGMCGVY